MPDQHLAVHITALSPGAVQPLLRTMSPLSSSEPNEGQGGSVEGLSAQHPQPRGGWGSGQGASASGSELVLEEEGSDEDDIEGEEEEGEEELYSDQRWRSVWLVARGACWEQRLAQVVQCVREQQNRKRAR